MTAVSAGPFAAPSMTGELVIAPAWLDYNNHLNMAFYNVLFDRALDETLLAAGLGAGYVAERNCSYMSVESHNCYVRELLGSDTVRVAVRVLDVDDKRLHVFCEMMHARDGWLAATSEWMFLHVDMAARRSAPWPADVRAALEAMKAAADLLGRPQRAGRAIAIPRKPA